MTEPTGSRSCDRHGRRSRRRAEGRGVNSGSERLSSEPAAPSATTASSRRPATVADRACGRRANAWSWPVWSSVGREHLALFSLMWYFQCAVKMAIG